MNWYIAVLKKYAVFSGRARRKEYWCFYLFNCIAFFLLAAVDAATGTFNPNVRVGLVSGAVGLLSGIYILAIFVPGMAVTVRRLHDIGHSGWLFLIILVPLVGPLALLYLLVQNGQEIENQYGPNPKIPPVIPPVTTASATETAKGG